MIVYIIKEGTKIELFKSLSLLCSVKKLCRQALYRKGINIINNEIQVNQFSIIKKQVFTNKDIINIYK